MEWDVIKQKNCRDESSRIPAGAWLEPLLKYHQGFTGLVPATAIWGPIFDRWMKGWALYFYYSPIVM